MRPAIVRWTICALGLVVSLPVVAQASEVARPDHFILQFLGKDPSVEAASACFARVYDPSHLAEHRRQKVAAMLLLVTGQLDLESKAVTYAYHMGVKFRGEDTRYRAIGECDHAAEAGGKARASFGCDLGCEDSGFTVSLVDHDTAQLILSRVEIAAMGRQPGVPKPLAAGKDDHIFLLRRASLVDCAPIAEEEKQPVD
jgi:hypothetical protein